MNHNDTFTKSFDIRHIMARHQDGGTKTFIIFGDECANPPLHCHIQADRRFVQKDYLRPV